jgi:predicted 2-oxoglutarate/Fe(II)-dependent dioxygenase YbiX
MEIKNFVKIYDSVLPLNAVGNLIKYANISEFQQTRVGADNNKEGRVDFNIRRTFAKQLSNLSNSLSEVHWFNILHNCFEQGINNYRSDLKLFHCEYKSIFDIEILKYENSGFYTWHVDHFSEIPRTLSCILLLNNDYEGGNLCFKNPDGSGEWEVEIKPNRLIIWPSNFLYPHTVKPLTKGKRYSVVAWAL